MIDEEGYLHKTNFHCVQVSSLDFLLVVVRFLASAALIHRHNRFLFFFLFVVRGIIITYQIENNGT